MSRFAVIAAYALLGASSMFSAGASALTPVTESEWLEILHSSQYGPPHNTTNPDTTGGKAPFRAHAALAAGMPTHWNWSRGSVRMTWNSIPPPTEAAVTTPVLTGRFGDAAPNTHGKNYRSHVRNYELWYFDTNLQRWVLLDKPKAKGGYYTKLDMKPTGSMTVKTETDGSVSFSPKADNWQHFYTSSWPIKVVGGPYNALMARAELKLSGPDAGTAKVLGNVGIDYKTMGPDGTTLDPEIAAGIEPQPAALQTAMKYVTPEYQWFTAVTMYSNEIYANPPPRPGSGSSVSIGLSPASVTLGQSSTLSWSSGSGSVCSASGAWAGSKSSSGSQSVTPSTTGSHTYTLSCTLSGTTSVGNATLVVNAPPASAPTLSLSASPVAVTLGSSSTLSWSSSNASSCAASGAWSGSKNLSGSQVVTPSSAATHSYTLSCTGAGGTTQRSVSVTAAQAVNSVPTAANDSYTVRKRTTTTLPVLDNDTDANGDELIITSVSTPDQAGEAEIVDGGTAISYKPRAGLLSAFTGVETFTYTVSDGNGGTDTATVTMTVTH